MKAFYLLGVDGSGKSTLSQYIIKKARSRNQHMRYLYARHFPILLAPLKKCAKYTIFRKENSTRNYQSYHQKKTNFTSKNRLIGKLYGVVWIMDYVLTTYLKIFSLYFRRGKTIIDRYYIDVVVNISDTLNIKNKDLVLFVKRFSKLFPTPSHIFYLNLPVEVAFSRKDDIDSLDYLQARKDKYDLLSKEFNFIELDATLSIEELSTIILTYINGE